MINIIFIVRGGKSWSRFRWLSWWGGVGGGKSCSCFFKSAYEPSGPWDWAYVSFCNMKWLGVFLLPSWWDASPSKVYPRQENSLVPIYTPWWGDAKWELSVLPKNTTQCPGQGSNPESSIQSPAHWPLQGHRAFKEIPRRSSCWIKWKNIFFRHQCVSYIFDL